MTSPSTRMPDSLLDVDWPSYFSKRGIPVNAVGSAEYLGGGVSAEVVRYADLIIKRPRTRLAVERVWNADTIRVVTEALVMSRMNGIAPPVVDFNEEDRILVMKLVDGVEWKTELLRGVIDEEVFAELGSALRGVHDLAPEDLDGAKEFEELRLVPYFDDAATRAPNYSADLRSVRDRLAASGTAVVHGDFSPKNILVRGGRPGTRTTILDWEVAHRGDPSFDLGFLATHILAKSVYLPKLREQLANGLAAFLAAYGDLDIEWTSKVTGALLIARLYGSSPLEYLSVDHSNVLEPVAESLLVGHTILTDAK